MNGAGQAAGRAGVWVRYQPGWGGAPGGEPWLGVLGLQSFRIILWLAIVTVATVFGFGVIFRGRIFLADAATAAALGVVQVLLWKRPAWFKPLAWLVLLILALDAVDGVWHPLPHPVVPTHVLIPMLVLYGALLCDLAMTAVAMAVALALCGATWARHAPLSADDAMMLSHVVLATTISGLTALAVWMHHRRLMRRLRQQAEELRFELVTNNRLNAVIFHDIANPLTALSGELELARLQGRAGSEELDRMGRMSGRIAAIIASVRATGSNRWGETHREPVTTERMLEELREVFAERLAAKEQTLALAAGSGLAVPTVPGVLLNTVLGNLLSNAIKFSPAGGCIELRAAREGRLLRVEIRDQGGGFPEALFRPGDRVQSPAVGTAGELGHGFGLDIVALYVAKLGGSLEIMNRPGGGASAAVLLPA